MKLNRLLNNIEIKLVCLLLAVVLWLYAGNPKGTETIDRLIKSVSGGEEGIITFRRLPIKLVGLQKKWKSNPDEVLLEVKCLEAEVDISSLQVLVNLRRKDEESRRVTLTTANVELPKGLIFLKAEPKEIRLIPVL
jgi:hypothetical protein